jgi:hypothetical protein
MPDHFGLRGQRQTDQPVDAGRLHAGGEPVDGALASYGYPGASLYLSDACILVEDRAMTTDAATSLPLYQRFADELSTLIRRGQLGFSFAPGRLFSASDRYRNCLRLSCGHRWSERTEQAIVKLGQLVRAGARAAS